MDISDQSLGVGLFVGGLLGALGGAGKGGLVVEAVQIASGVLELLDPFLWLNFFFFSRLSDQRGTHLPQTTLKPYLSDHHVAVKSSAAIVLLRAVDVLSDLGDNGSTKSDVGDKVPIPGPFCFSKQFFLPKFVQSGALATNMMSTCSQSAPCSMVRAQSWPNWAKSADSTEGAMMALGAILKGTQLREVVGRDSADCCSEASNAVMVMFELVDGPITWEGHSKCGGVACLL